MSIRITGMASGLDTESMITDLMNAYSKTKQKKVSTMTKYSWKMDAWSSLNKKINSFYSKALSNMRYSSSFNTKKTTVSDTTKAKVSANSTAIVGTQTLAVKQLAQAGYLTGGQLSRTDKKAVTEKTTLADLGYSGGATSFEVNGKTISLSESTKISDVVSNLTKSGLNANFDATNGRIFVSSKTMGEKGDFSITAGSSAGIDALSYLGLYTGVTSKADKEKYESVAAYNNGTTSTLVKNGDGTFSYSGDVAALIDAEIDKRNDSYAKAVTKANEDKANAEATITSKQDEINSMVKNAEFTDAETVAADILAKGLAGTLTSEEKEKYDLTDEMDYSDSSIISTLTDKALAARKAELNDNINSDAYTDAEKDGFKAELAEVNDAVKMKSDIDAANKEIAKAENIKTSSDATIADAYTYIDSTTGDSLDKLKNTVAEEFYNKVVAANNALSGSYTGTAVKQSGQDAVIYLNGAEFTSNKNTFDINGLSITCTDITGLNESGKEKVANGQDLTADDYSTVTLSTDIDIDGVYDTVKKFLKEYNELIKELETDYNADSAKDYDVLSDEEKDALSDTEVEEWEKKIKDSLLRRDENLDSVINTLKNGMLASFDINGKNYSLGSFGINTLSYFLAPENEKGVYHIDGDPDDSDTSSNDDLLKAAIRDNAEAVSTFFNKLATSMYTKMQKMSSTSTSRSFGSFYDDKTMKTQYSSYKTALSDYETKLGKIEDKYYKQFTAMESAMTKLQSSQTALGSLIGTN